MVVQRRLTRPSVDRPSFTSRTTTCVSGADTVVRPDRIHRFSALVTGQYHLTHWGLSTTLRVKKRIGFINIGTWCGFRGSAITAVQSMVVSSERVPRSHPTMTEIARIRSRMADAVRAWQDHAPSTASSVEIPRCGASGRHEERHGGQTSPFLLASDHPLGQLIIPRHDFNSNPVSTHPLGNPYRRSRSHKRIEDGISFLSEKLDKPLR